MPMIPELPIAMLACARIGAPHTVIFGGFSAEALAGRINDTEARLLITADGGWRRGRTVNLKGAADEALASTPSIEHALVVRRIGDQAAPVAMKEGRDVWWHDIVDRQSEQHEPVPWMRAHAVPAVHLGHDREAQGDHAHDRGVPARHELHARDRVRPQAGRRVLVRGGHRLGHRPLVHRVRAARQRDDRRALRGRAGYTDVGSLVADHRGLKVSILYCAPTAIRAFMKQGESFPRSHDLSSLRVLGSVGEPINPEAWLWYHEHIGGGKAPVVDTWWQTETGMIMISPLRA
jgi:acetyl-CoA synthetase